MAGRDPDHDLRRAALEAARDLQRAYDDLVPLDALRKGFRAPDGRRLSFGSFFNGIHRPSDFRGPAALSITTTPPKPGKEAPYADEFDEASGVFTYHYRTASNDSAAARLAAAADNRALVAALEHGVPLIYFRGIAPAQYAVVAPVFITANDEAARTVQVQAALPIADTTEEGLVSDENVRRYATREAAIRLHQHRFRAEVLRAYGTRCAVCVLREAPLLEAAHIIGDREARGLARIDNGIALCAIHHTAYDRNLMGIDPGGVVHIAHRLLDEQDGPMLRYGLQGFHGRPMHQPRRATDRPDPDRLATRFEVFSRAA